MAGQKVDSMAGWMAALSVAAMVALRVAHLAVLMVEPTAGLSVA